MTERAAERLLVVGTNHRTSALSLRDALFMDDATLPSSLEALRAAGLREALLLSTCDRVEVIAAADDPGPAAAQALGFLAARASMAAEDLTGQVYVLAGTDAVRHLFAVAGALDSQIVGEPHVLGQLKAAHRLARDALLSGPDLEACLQAAYATAKRLRSETAVAEGPVSVASSAVQAARDLFGDLSGLHLLIAAGGDMGDLVAESLLAAQCGLGKKGSVSVTARRPARAEQAARVLGERGIAARVLPFEHLTASLPEADLLITAIGGRTWAVAEENIRAALRKRRQRPMLLVDVGVPGDVEPAINRLDNAFLYDLNDLERVAEQGRAQREAAARAAWEIVTAEVERFARARAERTAVPAIAALHRRFEAERARALAEAPGDAERATRLLVGRLLHAPSETLRALASDGGSDEAEAAQTLLRRLFRLEAADGEDTPSGKDPA